MSPSETQILARQLMELHGLTSWKFKFDRAKLRAGLCSYSRKCISLSIYYVNHNQDKPDDVRDTILHEIAHALAGSEHGHDVVWKAICLRIGARPLRCYDSSIVEMPKGRWRAVCPGCSKEFRRHRRLRRYRTSYCLRCGTERGNLTYSPAASLLI